MRAFSLAFEMPATEDLLLLSLVVVGPVMAAFGIFQLVTDLRAAPRKRVIGRLKGRTGIKERGDKSTAGWEDLRKQTSEAGGTLGRVIGNLRFTARFQTVLEQANVPWSASHVLVNLTVGASVLLAVLMLLKVKMLVAAGVAAAVFILPILYLVHRRKKRLNRLVLQLPEVFELLSQALRAGHSLASGMQLVAEELPDPAGTEFGRPICAPRRVSA